MSQFYILSADAFKAMQVHKSHTLSTEEAEILVKSKEIIRKYFQLKVDSMRSQLGNGDFQGNETPIYWTISAIEQFAKELDDMEKQIEAFKELQKKHKK